MKLAQNLWLVFCCGLFSAVIVFGQTSRPNVIIIVSDDQGYGDFSAHGNPVLKTPHLDRLRSESVRFSDFHVAPMCTPTRGQLMTGMDALRNGATSVTAGRSYIRRGIPLMSEIFKQNRYRTALFGKWHLGDSYPNWPHLQGGGGFDEAVHHMGWGINSIADHWLNDNFDDWYRHNGKLEQYKGYCTDVWFDLSMNWMKERAAKKEPFLLYLPTNAPHGPLWVADKYAEPYKGKGPAQFFGMIANLDENIGRLEAFLQASGLRDNTIVMFFNDNGGTAGVRTFNAGMRGQKTTNYEGGHRAALFVRWPNGKLKVGDVDTPTQVQDLLPTLIDVLQLKKPASAKFDGVSIASLLRGAALPERKFVVQYGQTPKKWDGAVVWNKWRLVNGEELYDLKTDPAQEKNVAAQHSEILQQMRSHYEQWWAGVEPRLNEFYHVSLGAPQENPVTLTAIDWANVYCDNVVNCVRPGQKQNGIWHVQIEQSGTYEIALRRWPKEADAALTAAVPEFRIENRAWPVGVALPIAKARLKIGDRDETKTVAATDKEAAFNVTLKAGAKLTMQSWFYDAQGNELCGAYYAYVRRK